MNHHVPLFYFQRILAKNLDAVLIYSDLNSHLFVVFVFILRSKLYL